MRRISEREMVPLLAQAGVGASHSIDIGISPWDPDTIRYVNQDLCYLADQRITRRLLLPGFGEAVRIPSAVELYDHGWERFLTDDLQPFFENNWEIRTAPYSRLGFTIIFDEEHAIHAYPDRGHKVTEFVERTGRKEIGELLWMFKDGWTHGSQVQPIYRDEIDFTDEEEIREIVAFSDEHFKDMLKFFAKNPEKMREMPPRKFEEFVADLFQKEGHTVELTPETRDGGRDIIIVSDSSLGRHLHLVECKRYGEDNPVDVKLVRSLYGVVEAEKATAGILVTTTRVTQPAVDFINSVKNRLSKKDYDDLVRWLKKHAGS